MKDVALPSLIFHLVKMEGRGALEKCEEQKQVILPFSHSTTILQAFYSACVCVTTLSHINKEQG